VSNKGTVKIAQQCQTNMFKIIHLNIREANIQLKQNKAPETSRVIGILTMKVKKNTQSRFI